MNSGFRRGKKAPPTYRTYINTSTTDTPIWRFMWPNYSDDTMPKKYYINEKKKTVVLKWYDDSITKVKVSENDKFDARYGFLIAYFQKKCGMSKTKSNKYLENLGKNSENISK